MFGQKKLLVRISEAARLLSISQASVKRLIADGTLPIVQIERATRVPFAALEAFIADVGNDEKQTLEPVRSACLTQNTTPALMDVPERPRPSKKNMQEDRKSDQSTRLQIAANSVDSVHNAQCLLENTTPPDGGTTRMALPPSCPITTAKRYEVRTVALLMREWLRDAEMRVRPRTHASYAQMVRLHIIPELGSVPLAAVHIRTVEDFLRDKRDAGLSARTVLYLRAILRQAFQDAVRWDWLTRNVISLTRGPKQEHNMIEVLSLEESRRLLASFRHPRHGLLFMTTLGLGLRFGEVLGLRWKDVSLADNGEGGEAAVRVQLQKVNKKFVLVPPKSRSGIRALALPGFVARALKERQRIEAEERLVAGHTWEGDDWGLVFSNQRGGPLDESRIRQRFREHLAQHGFPAMRFHDLRHQCASLLIAQGTSPRVVMDILGHSQISLTMNTYSHVMPATNQAAAITLNEILCG